MLLQGLYEIGDLLGKGSWGEVRRGRNVQTNQAVAIKLVDLKKIMEPKECSRQRLTLQREISILKLLNHPNIVKLYDAFEHEDKFYLIMELVTGGELFHYVLNRKVLKEDEARRFFRQMTSAIEYCHSCLVIHRDIKLENVLLDESGNIKITDFGFSNFIEPGQLFKTFCGSPMYSPPEIFSGQRYLGPPADIWSLGVILFAMVTGYLPFSDANDNLRTLRRRVCMGDFQVPEALSPDCKHLIKKMMRVRQEQRITVQGLRKHPWVNKGYTTKPDSFLPSYPKVTTIRPDVLDQLVALGFDRDHCIKQIQANKPASQIVATYYHVLRQKENKPEERPQQQQQLQQLQQQQSQQDCPVSPLTTPTPTAEPIKPSTLSPWAKWKTKVTLGFEL